MNHLARKLYKHLTAALLLAGLSLSPYLAALPKNLSVAPPIVDARSYVLIDATSGTVLAEKNADLPLPPASLTKMMTAYVIENELAAGHMQRDDMVTVSEKAWRMRGSLMFIEVGEKVSVENLLKGIIVVSGNDASVALAEHTGGSEQAFATMMNNTADKLGMKNSHFKNSSGWPVEGHHSSARDLSLLAKAIIQDHPEYYALYNLREFQYGHNKSTGNPLDPQPNRNTLLFSNPGVDGLKTGHTDEAGYCLAASEKKEDRRLIAVVMGTESRRSRASETQKLLTYGFRFFENHEVKRGGTSLQSVRIWKGAQNHLAVGLAHDLIVTIPRGQSNKITAMMSIEPNLEAPILKDQKVGSVLVKLGDEVIQEEPLLALQTVEKGGLFKSLWDAIVRFFLSLVN